LSPLLYIPAALTCTAIGFYLANLLALRAWRKQPSPPPADIPVSVLKPLKGCDAEMMECFRAHCRQAYSAPYELIFGVNDAADEAVPFVAQLKQEFPERDITLLVCDQVLGANRKVSNLAQMAARARYAHLVVNDSDIEVPADYLSRVMRYFARPEVGLVTCLYRAVPGNRMWSKVEALGVLADFMPGALTARLVEGRVRFGLGSTLAVSRPALDGIGGFVAIADHLADDYQLADRIVKNGGVAVVADTVVETKLPDYDFTHFWQHQLRWGRTVRSSRPGGYASLVITFGFFWSLLWLLVSRGSWMALAGFVILLATRFAVLFVYARARRQTAQQSGLRAR
jgi:ceramide glucosyltransferase